MVKLLLTRWPFHSESLLGMAKSVKDFLTFRTDFHRLRLQVRKKRLLETLPHCGLDILNSSSGFSTISKKKYLLQHVFDFS
jgi:hypothetical protein